MNKFLFGLVFIISTQSIFAHHVVSEISSSNKLIIKKDFNEKIKGDKAEYVKDLEKRSGFSNESYGEHALPNIGDKVKIYRTFTKYSDGKNKRVLSHTKELVGTATLVSPDTLMGDSRSVTISTRGKRTKESVEKVNYSEKEINDLKSGSFVAVPEDGIKVKTSDIVEF